MKARLQDLKNIGPKMVGYLSQINIHTVEELQAKGPVDTFLALSELSKHLQNRMALYALYGALSDQNCLFLPDETKEWLEEELIRVGYVGAKNQ